MFFKKKCAWCKKEITKEQAFEKKFCSEECANRYKKELSKASRPSCCH